MEAFSVRIWLREGASGIGVLPPVAIAAGALTFPGLPAFVRWTIATLGVVYHFTFIYLCATGVIPRGKKRE